MNVTEEKQSYRCKRSLNQSPFSKKKKLFLIYHFGGLFAKHGPNMTEKETQPNSYEFLAK